MPQKLNYSDVSFIFHKLFENANEAFWYQKAWSILNKYELNNYTNIEEKLKVYINAATLGVIYEDAFAIIDDSYSDYDEYIENLQSIITKENQIPSFKNLFMKEFLNDKSLNYDFEDELDGYENLSNALLMTINENRYNILQTLEKEMNETEIALAIYCSGLPIYEPIKLEEYEEDDYDKPEYADILSMIDYNSYWKSFKDNFDELYYLYENKLPLVFSWLQEGANQRE